MAVPPAVYTVKIDVEQVDGDLKTKTERIENRLSGVEEKLMLDVDKVDSDLKTKTERIENCLSGVEDKLKKP
ncbi:hypothetical protein ACP4OV_031415 [Aristida adscensionis]